MQCNHVARWLPEPLISGRIEPGPAGELGVMTPLVKASAALDKRQHYAAFGQTEADAEKRGEAKTLRNLMT